MSDVAEPVAGQNSANTEIDKIDNISISKGGDGRRFNGGPRPGAGRPKGAVSLETKERLAIRKEFEDRIHNSANVLLNAALTKALGESFLIRKITERDSKGKVLRVYHETVTDQQTILQYFDEGMPNDFGDDDEYYYISTKPVDMVAVKELYDRAFGRPLQKSEVGGPGGEPLGLGLTPEQANQLLALRAAEADSAN